MIIPVAITTNCKYTKDLGDASARPGAIAIGGNGRSGLQLSGSSGSARSDSYRPLHHSRHPISLPTASISSCLRVHAPRLSSVRFLATEFTPCVEKLSNSFADPSSGTWRHFSRLSALIPCPILPQSTADNIGFVSGLCWVVDRYIAASLLSGCQLHLPSIWILPLPSVTSAVKPGVVVPKIKVSYSHLDLTVENLYSVQPLSRTQVR